MTDKLSPGASRRIAALYVTKSGVYYGLDGVDPWDEERDARLYSGPDPVVAHPPCQRWSLMGLCRGYYDGQDGGCFEAALHAVRTYGGVLEHPAHTLAWKTYGLAKPSSAGWTRSLLDEGWTCEVDQRFYGHGARKPTWLYAYGVDLPEFRWGTGERGEWTVGRVPGSKQWLREETPIEFRDALISMARSARVTSGWWVSLKAGVLTPVHSKTMRSPSTCVLQPGEKGTRKFGRCGIGGYVGRVGRRP